MPICSNCGAYYIRPPCPSCESGQVETDKKRTSWFRRKEEAVPEEAVPEEAVPEETVPEEAAKPAYTSVITRIADLANQIEEKNRIISELETRIAEQQDRIQKLQDEIVRLKN